MVGDKYIKRTSRFGAFHGSVVLTEYTEEARVWAREADATYSASNVRYRAKTFTRDKKKLIGDVQVVGEPT